MTSQSGKETITIDILPNITRSKGNQTLKFCQLIEYHMTNIFLEKACTKYGEETSPRSLFLKKRSTVSSSIVCFYCMSKSRTTKYILKLRCWTLAFTSYKAFAFTFWDIWQYVYCTFYSVTLPYLSYQAIFFND